MEACRRRPAGTVRDRRGGARRGLQRLERQVLREAVARLVALDDAHADAELDLPVAAVDLAVLETERVEDAVLEVEIRVIASA